MSNQYRAVAAILGQAITSINAILTCSEDEMHRIRVTNNLQREADQLLLLTGTGDLTTGETSVLGPAKTIGGKPIKQQRRFTEADLVPSDDKVFNLKQQVENAVTYFGPDASAEGILVNIPDLIIRGVAKKAGLKVTKDEPKELTVEFIEEVKEALALLPKLIEIGKKLTEDDVIKLADAIMKPVTAESIKAEETDKNATDAEAAEFGMSAAKDLYDMIKEVKAEEPKQETKPKQETDLKKKAGK
jgi:hypothetical protein